MNKPATIALVIPPGLWRRLSKSDRRALDPTRVCTGWRRPTLPKASEFETEERAAHEDKRRLAQLSMLLDAPVAPAVDRAAVLSLRHKLEGEALGMPSNSLASSSAMRRLRAAYIPAVQRAFAPYTDDELVTVTVIYRGWTHTVATLEHVTAANVRAQFIQHLNRVGVTKMPDPLLAMLDGEFEPTSGTVVLHFQVATTRRKAKRLMLLKQMRGYGRTATGAPAIHVSRMGNRERQLSYLLKAFWPSRAVRDVGGEWKRDRHYHRIPEPTGSKVLLWQDRQRLADLVILNRCWSPRLGGTKAMHNLYLVLHGRSAKVASKG